MPNNQQGPTGLRTIVQKRLLDDVLYNSMRKHPGWMILVMDKPATRMISSVIGMYDLMEQRISLVEDISKKRAPFRDKAVIYLLAPTKESVELMLADWTPSENVKEPLYGNGAFIYFLGALPEPLLARIKSCKALVKRVKGLGELNIDFLAKETSAFHLDMDSTFSTLFKRAGRPSRAEFVICDKLVTACATLNEYPHIRYQASSPLSTSLAKIFHTKMNEFVGKNQNWWHHGDANHTDRGRATLLLLDRTADCLSPLMHEFTYQAMVNDLLKVVDDKITYESETAGTAEETVGGKSTVPKDALLNENDEVWVELRGDHIADVIQKLSGRIRDIVNSNTAQVLTKKGNSAKALSLSQMANAMKQLPEYREVMSKLSQHMHIAHQCMDLFNKAGLMGLSELEQTLATGKDENGRTPKVSELVDLVENELKSADDALTRLRLLGIFIVSQRGIRGRDKDRLLRAARLNPKAARTLQNLQKMGCPLIQKTESSKLKSIFGQRAASSGRNDAESEYSTSRYVCLLKMIMQEMNEGTLSLEEYPSVVPMPDEGSSSGTATSARNRQSISGSARRDTSRASRWSRQEAKPVKRNTYSGARQIVFMAGGLCYSEIRSVYEVMESGEKEFIVGGTRFLNPRQFARELSTL